MRYTPVGFVAVGAEGISNPYPFICAEIMRAVQRCVAIVLAMGVVALAAMAAAAMMVTQSTWSRQGELTAEHAQAQALIQAGVDWTRAVLSDDRRSSSVDHRGEPWALRLPPPYLAANRPLIDVAELVLVRGFDDSVRARLRPFVTALLAREDARWPAVVWRKYP